MNTNALILAILGSVGIMIALSSNKFVKNNILGITIQVFGTLLAIILVGQFSPNTEVAATAGSYLFPITIVLFILKKIIFKKAKIN